MTVEAVQLVIQAGAALVLDTGERVHFADIAEIWPPRPTKIAYTGPRAGEKLHQVLHAEDEVDHRRLHTLIAQVPVPRLDPDLDQQFDPLGSEVDGLAASVALRLPRDGTPPARSRAHMSGSQWRHDEGPWGA